MRWQYFFLLILLFKFDSSIAQFQGYSWPTNASNHLSATFGETRSAHFHSGLDIKTWGREGYSVFAAKDGYISRIGISARGYGRVLYVKHPDGNTTVYAHLQRFRPDIQQFVDSLRLLSNTFEIELYPDSSLFPVNQRDLIGFSGSTGIGPPHLHFEIRDSHQRPINALRAGYDNIKDEIPPVLSAILAKPMSPETRIRSSAYPSIFYPIAQYADTVDFGLIEANGPFGITLSNYDGANQVTNKYAIYRLSLFKEDKKIFSETLNEFSFDEAETMFIDRVAAFGGNRRSYQKLFITDGPDVPFYTKADSESIITPSDSAVKFTIIAEDFFGNTTTGVFKVQKTNRETAPSELNINPLNWYWRNNWAALNSDSTLDFNTKFGPLWKKGESERLLTSGNKMWHTARINPNKNYSLTSYDQRIKLKIRSHTFFDTLTVAMYHQIEDSIPVISVLPDDLPARKDFEIQFYIDSTFEANNNYRLFRFSRNQDRISYVNSYLQGRTIYGFPSGTGEFVVFPDNEAPEISYPRFYTTDYGENRIVVRVQDNLTGIDFSKSQIVVNGISGITEYDFEEGTLIYLHPELKTTPGKRMRVQVLVYDHAGNSDLKAFQL